MARGRFSVYLWVISCCMLAYASVNDATTIIGPSCSCDNQTTSLVCNSQGITNLPVLSECLNLQQITLAGNGITGIPAGWLRGVSQIRSINFPYNQISLLPSDLLAGITTITDVDFSGNRLTALPPNLMINQTNFGTYRLGGNQQLGYLDNGTFAGCQSLSWIEMYSNGLTSVPADLIKNLKQLQYLYMGSNHLTSIPAGFFDGLTRLQRIQLSGNPLGSLSAYLFSDCVMLNQLFCDSSQVVVCTPTGQVTTCSSQNLDPNNPYDYFPIPSVMACSVPTTTIVGIGSCSCNRFSTSLQCSGRGIASVQVTLQSNCFRLQSIDLSNNSLTELSTGVFDGLSALQQINLAGNRLSNATGMSGLFNPGTLAGLTSLQSVNLGNNLIDNLGSGSMFNGTTTLTSLDLNNNNISSLPLLFVGQTQLTSIDLSASGISMLNPGLFANLTALSTLLLSRNRINSLDNGTFADLRSATIIDLSSNALVDLPVGAFSGLTALQVLNLSYNNIRSVPAGTFVNLTALSTLDMTFNSITSLPTGVFVRVPVLSSLLLSYNNISDIGSGTFFNFTSAVVVDLSYNSLTSIASGMLSGLTSVSSLKLSYNSITSLAGGCFADLRNASSLYVENNLITSLPSGLLDNMTSLIEVYLFNNSIVSLGGQALSSLTKLQRFDAYNNALTSIVASLFASSHALQRIDLNTNQLTAIDGAQFTGLTALQYLDISYNQISQVSPTQFGNLGALTLLAFYKNRITSLAATQFTGLSALQYLNFDFNSLTALAPSQFSGLSHLYKLGFGGNRIPSLDVNLFVNLTNLNQLYINSNLLTSIISGTFHPLDSLRILLAHDNRFTAVPLDLLNLAYLNTVSLHSNTILAVSPNLSAYFAARVNSLVISMALNPSQCQYVYDAQVLGRRFVCDCAAGYFGVDYCAPISDFVVLPLLLASNTPRVLSSPQLTGGPQTISFPNYTGAVPLVVSFNLVPLPSAVNLPVVSTVFAVSAQNVPLPATSISLVTSLYAPFVYLFQAPGNPNIPAIFSYQLAASSFSSSPPSGLSFDTSSGNLSGAALSSMQWTFNVWSTDLFTNESKLINFVTMSILDCGNSTCENGGVCIDVGDPMDNMYSCTCATGFGGTRCSAHVLQSSAPAISSSTATVLGVVLGAVLIGVVMLSYVVVKRRLLLAAQRKDYHIFISYRVEADKDIALALFDQLAQRTIPLSATEDLNVKVFLDSKNIGDASDWKEVFLTALKHSCLFVPLVSEATLQPMLSMEHLESRPDNVLLEYQTAVELKKKKLVSIFPIFIGHRTATSTSSMDLVPRFDFEQFGSHNFPETGAVTNPHVPVRETISSIFAQQGLFFSHITADGGIQCMAKPGEEQSVDVAERVCKAMETSAWDNQTIQGRKHWRRHNPRVAPAELTTAPLVCDGEEGGEDGHGGEQQYMYVHSLHHHKQV